MNADWPKTIRVGGETYTVGPDQPTREYVNAADALQIEADKLADLADALGVDVPDNIGTTGAGEEHQ